MSQLGEFVSRFIWNAEFAFRGSDFFHQCPAALTFVFPLLTHLHICQLYRRWQQRVGAHWEPRVTTRPHATRVSLLRVLDWADIWLVDPTQQADLQLWPCCLKPEVSKLNLTTSQIPEQVTCCARSGEGNREAAALPLHQLRTDRPTTSPSAGQGHGGHQRATVPWCPRNWGIGFLNVAGPVYTDVSTRVTKQLHLSLIHAVLPRNEMIFPIMGDAAGFYITLWTQGDPCCRTSRIHHSSLFLTKLGKENMNSKTPLFPSVISTVTCLGFRNHFALFCSYRKMSWQGVTTLFSRFHLSPTTTAVKRKTNKLRSVLSKCRGNIFYRKSKQFCTALFKCIYWNFPRAFLM